MRTVLALTLAFALLGGAALLPTAAADISFGIDQNGDRHCDDPGEQYSIPTPDPIHRHGPCNV